MPRFYCIEFKDLLVGRQGIRVTLILFIRLGVGAVGYLAPGSLEICCRVEGVKERDATLRGALSEALFNQSSLLLRAFCLMWLLFVLSSRFFYTEKYALY